jgi:transcriptional regulator with XRE-family HTH domain
MRYFPSNLKFLRKNHNPKQNQASMAAFLGVSISTFGSYEEGRAEPKLENLKKIADFFGISMDELLTTDLSRTDSRTQMPKTESGLPFPGPKILAITVDKTGKDNVEWVPVKAAAGYAAGFGDPDFVEKLPAFQIPFLDPRKKYRAFTIEGDSMLPMVSGSTVFAEYLEDWSQIKDDSPCIVITQSDGVVFKKVFNYLKSQNCLLLVSSNPQFNPYLVPAQEVLEVWKFAGYFSSQMP